MAPFTELPGSFPSESRDDVSLDAPFRRNAPLIGPSSLAHVPLYGILLDEFARPLRPGMVVPVGATFAPLGVGVTTGPTRSVSDIAEYGEMPSVDDGRRSRTPHQYIDAIGPGDGNRPSPLRSGSELRTTDVESLRLARGWRTRYEIARNTCSSKERTRLLLNSEAGETCTRVVCEGFALESSLATIRSTSVLEESPFSRRHSYCSKRVSPRIRRNGRRESSSFGLDGPR